VFGNILQSTRGIMAVVAGAALAHLGWHDLEERVDRATLIRRFAAAVLMTAAVCLFVIDLSGGNRHPAGRTSGDTMEESAGRR